LYDNNNNNKNNKQRATIKEQLFFYLRTAERSQGKDKILIEKNFFSRIVDWCDLHLYLTPVNAVCGNHSNAITLRYLLKPTYSLFSKRHRWDNRKLNEKASLMHMCVCSRVSRASWVEWHASPELQGLFFTWHVRWIETSYAHWPKHFASAVSKP